MEDDAHWDRLRSRADRVAPALEPAALPRVLSRASARQHGYSEDEIDRLVAARRWRRVLPRTFLTSDVLTWNDRLTAALCFAGDGAALSGAAALVELGLRGVRRPEAVLVLVPPANRTRSHAWVQVRASRRAVSADLRPGPRLVSPGRAVADHALTLTAVDDVRAVVAAAVRDRHASVDELVLELENGPRQGSGHLRQVIKEVSDGAWSAPEARAARALRRAGAPAFEQNVRLVLRDGRAFTVDFFWRGLRAVLEIDSRDFHFEAADWRATMDRHLALTTDGYSVVHRPPSEVVWDEAGFVHDVLAWLAARATELR